MTRQHEGLDDPSSRQCDPSSSASPSSITHLRPGRKGDAHNSCRMQAHHVSRHFLSFNPLIEGESPLALHLCHVLLDHFQDILSCDPSMFIETRAPTS